MASLSRAELMGRLAFDAKVARELRSPALGAVRAFTSDEAYRAGQDATASDLVAGRATIYLVTYTFPVLVGPGQTISAVMVRYDLLAGGNYPYSPPLCTTVSRPLPWSPHSHPIHGTVCLGDGWESAGGKMLLAQLIIHVMRILNCDEQDQGPLYFGWNAPAIRYWRSVMQRRPVNPDLAYPTLPVEVTHGEAAVGGGFTPAGSSPSGAFQPAGSGFRSLGRRS